MKPAAESPFAGFLVFRNKCDNLSPRSFNNSALNKPTKTGNKRDNRGRKDVP